MESAGAWGEEEERQTLKASGEKGRKADRVSIREGEKDKAHQSPRKTVQGPTQPPSKQKSTQTHCKNWEHVHI